MLYRLTSAQKYTTFSIRKRNGTNRTIEAPHPALKRLQQRLLPVISELAPASVLAKGYVPKRSVIDHAWMHRRKRWVVLADPSDFFPSITFQRIRGAFLSRPFCLAPEVATCVAQLCCKDGTLPQGAPTSPALSNLICRSLDHSLLNLAKRNRFSVSRYADDICFSTSKIEIPDCVATKSKNGWLPGTELIETITANGFRLNPEKFKVISTQEQQLVTGLIVNDGLSLPRKWRRQLRVVLHLVEKRGEKNASEIMESWKSPIASRSGCKDVTKLIRGKINFSRHVDDRCNRSFSDTIFRNYPKLRKYFPLPKNRTLLRLMTEGKTDLLHLEAAYRAFVNDGEFINFNPRFLNFEGDSSDSELFNTLNRIAKCEVAELTIGVFDCDNDRFMKANNLSPGHWSRLGSNVFALCLAPTQELIDRPFCIELLYPRPQLCAVTEDSRRIFLTDEFDQETGTSLDGVYKRQHPRKTALVVSDQVTRISDGYSALLSKSDFADLVHQGRAPFSNINFSGFIPTFRKITEIIKIHLER